MNREIYNKIREFSVDMYTQGYEDGYEDGKKDSCEIDKLKGHTTKPNYPVRDCKTCKNSRDGEIALTATCYDCCMSDSKYESTQSEYKCVDDEIRVGDEVIMYSNCNYKGVVISIPYGERFNVLSEDGGVWIVYDKDDITKTGRHFPLITEMLDQLKEEIKE